MIVLMMPRDDAATKPIVVRTIAGITVEFGIERSPRRRCKMSSHSIFGNSSWDQQVGVREGGGGQTRVYWGNIMSAYRGYTYRIILMAWLTENTLVFARVILDVGALDAWDVSG
jgi:hypothetical protein